MVEFPHCPLVDINVAEGRGGCVEVLVDVDEVTLVDEVELVDEDDVEVDVGVGVGAGVGVAVVVGSSPHLGI